MLDLSRLRVMYTGGEAVPYHKAEEFEARTGATILNMYGSNETGVQSYTTLDDPRELRLETGLFVAEPSAGDSRVVPGVLPSGRYGSLRRTGHPDQLVTEVAGLLDWADRRGLKWDMKSEPDGEHWGARFEVYHTDPATEPDASKWDIELLFRLAD